MPQQPLTYTKPALIEKFKEIAAMGWVPNGRHGNAGGIGNTLEDLLGIAENNLDEPLTISKRVKEEIKRRMTLYPPGAPSWHDTCKTTFDWLDSLEETE